MNYINKITHQADLDKTIAEILGSTLSKGEKIQLIRKAMGAGDGNAVIPSDEEIWSLAEELHQKWSTPT